jgi:hypothetical protein
MTTDFWISMFKPRSIKWRTQHLRELKKSRSIFETEADRQDKIKALKALKNKRW